MGFIFQQLSAKSNSNSGLGYKKWNFFKAREKANNEKEVFLVLLGTDSSDSKMGGA